MQRQLCEASRLEPTSTSVGPRFRDDSHFRRTVQRPAGRKLDAGELPTARKHEPPGIYVAIQQVGARPAGPAPFRRETSLPALSMEQHGCALHEARGFPPGPARLAEGAASPGSHVAAGTVARWTAPQTVPGRGLLLPRQLSKQTDAHADRQPQSCDKCAGRGTQNTAPSCACLAFALTLRSPILGSQPSAIAVPTPPTGHAFTHLTSLSVPI